MMACSLAFVCVLKDCGRKPASAFPYWACRAAMYVFHGGGGRDRDARFKKSIVQLPVRPLQILLHEPRHDVNDLLVLLRFHDGRLVSLVWASSDWPELRLTPRLCRLLLVPREHDLPRHLAPVGRLTHEYVLNGRHGRRHPGCWPFLVFGSAPPGHAQMPRLRHVRWTGRHAHPLALLVGGRGEPLAELGDRLVGERL